MEKFSVPKRIYADGPKKMVSHRLPKRLTEQLETVARERGWTVTDLITTVLDEYLQWQQERDKKERKR